MNQEDTKEMIYSEVIYQLKVKKYCIIYGASKSNVDKVKYVEDKILENDIHIFNIHTAAHKYL